MKNYSSRKTIKKGGIRFRTPSTFLVREAEQAKRSIKPLRNQRRTQLP